MREPKEFNLTEEHLTLLRAANVTWDGMEWGAPAIDGKRPYGNGNLPDDIADKLGMDCGDEMDEGTRESLLALHAETETALQIVLATSSFRPGLYRTSSPYTRDWKLVGG